MAFLETPRFPERIAFGAVGGPMFRTEIAVSLSGRESRNGAWAYPRHAWDVSQGVKTADDFATLRAFFMIARGRQHAWRFKDWTDFSATHSDGRATGITSTTFQLVKRYTSGSSTQDRVVKKPKHSTAIEVKVSGVVTAHTLDTATGIVTIVSAPSAANVTWAGEFDVPMRFDTDKLDGRIVTRQADGGGLLHEWDSIPVIEVPV